MLKKKLTSALIAEIVDARREGATYADCAARFGLSAGSVANALRRHEKACVLKLQSEAAGGSEEPVELDVGAVRADLDEQPTGELLRLIELVDAQGRRARAEGDVASLAGLGRLRVSIAEALRKRNPAEHPPPTGLTSEEMRRLGADVTRRFEEAIEALCGPTERGPRCASCGAPTAPGDSGELRVPPAAVCLEEAPEVERDPSIEWWRHALAAEGSRCLEEDNRAGFMTLSRVALTFDGHIRKVEPPPRSDPNEDPDMVAFAHQVQARFAKMLAVLVDEVGPPCARCGSRWGSLSC